MGLSPPVEISWRAEKARFLRKPTGAEPPPPPPPLWQEKAGKSKTPAQRRERKRLEKPNLRLMVILLETCPTGVPGWR